MGRGKRFLLLTACKIASRFSKAPAGTRARSGEGKRRPFAFLLVPSLICHTASSQAAPSGQPAFSSAGGGPEGRRLRSPRPDLARRHATSCGSSRDVTPLPPPTSAELGGAPHAPAEELGRRRVPPRWAVTGEWSSSTEASEEAPRAGGRHRVF